MTPFNAHCTKSYDLTLLHLCNTTVPALQRWPNDLLTLPNCNYQFRTNLYTPMSLNQYGDITRQIAQRILPTVHSLRRHTVHPTSLSPHCRGTEALTHLLLDCPLLRSFWYYIESLISKLSPTGPQLSYYLKLFGCVRNTNDPLPLVTTKLINCVLATARYAIHKSATTICHKNTVTMPLMIFTATFQAQVQFRYKVSKLRHVLYYYQLDWCINVVIAKVADDGLTIIHNILRGGPQSLKVVSRRVLWEKKKTGIEIY